MNMGKLRSAAPLAVYLLASPVWAQEPMADHMPASKDEASDMAKPAVKAAAPMGGDQMDHGAMGHEIAPMPAHAMAMTGALGPYAMSREASGTSWQPDAAAHGGVHTMAGEWMVMSHALLNGVYDWQDGPRGDEKAFVSGMAMVSARRDLANGDVINLRVMASPEPLMGKSGYPLLLAAGETADGATTLVDRQHPHDALMELSASYTHALGAKSGIYVYGGLPGEPAFGPPAFMHRVTAMDSPEAPLSHHWLDSTHITFGVLTAGYVHDNWKVEASRFNGREPDEDRYDIETGALDSTTVRASWNPDKSLALQVSWADLTEPEQLAPGRDEKRWSASALVTRPLGEGTWSTTLAVGAKKHDGDESHAAFLVETAFAPNDQWTVFARAERIETEELAPGVQTVGRLSLGAIRDFRVSEHAKIGVGALVEEHFTPSALDGAYGDDLTGAMAFVRLKIG